MTDNQPEASDKSWRQSEEGYRSFFASLDQAYCVIEMLFDADGKPRDYRFLEVNPAFIKVTGWPHAVGMQISELVSDHDAKWLETYANVAMTGESIRFLQQTHARDARWFDLFACRVGDPDKRMIAVLFTEVADTRRVTDAPSIARTELNEIIELAPSFMVVIRGSAHVIEVANDAYRRLVGQRDLIGRTLREVFPEVEGQGFFELIDRVYATGEPWVGKGVSVFLHRKPGEAPEERFLDFVYQALRAVDGSVDGVFAHGIDITERKHAEDALGRLAEDAARQARVFDTCLSAMTDFVYTFDRQGQLLYANKALLTLLGKSSQEVIGKSLFELAYPDELAAKLYRQIQQVFDTGERIVDETPFTGDAGVPGHFEYILCPVPGTDGKVELVTGATREITSRKQTEELLRDADRRKTDFLAMLAHELRNPLAPIRSAVQLLRMTHGTHEAAPSMLAMMERQVTQMVRLIDDLLDVSRIIRGTVDLRLERAALASVVQQAVEAAQPLFESLGQELSVTLPAKPIYLLADPARLSQAIGNLLNNASKFTDREGQVQISVTRQAGEAVVRVSDSGVGIAGDHLHHIFEMFIQLDASLDRSRGGLGIGLALVKDLVEMHGGTVAAYSGGVGMGSEFVLRVPLLADELALPVATTEKLLTSVALRILVVDDNADAANSLAMLLKVNGHDVVTAYDGKQASDATERSKFDVVLLDIGLPKLDGYAVARHVRSLSDGAEIMLVAMTGLGRDDDRQRAAEAGFDAHRTKPVDYDDLCRLINTRKAKPMVP